MFKELIRDIIRLGFSDKEATVYVALLRLGSATTQDIADEAQMNRATTHDTLEHLSRSGLVTPYAENGQRRFSAEPPERLLNVLYLQRREVDLREDLAERLLPQLVAINTTNVTKPKIRYIEGIDGLRNMQREYETYDGELIQLFGYDAFRGIEDRKMTTEHQEMLTHGGKLLVRSIAVTDENITFPKHPSIEYRRISPSVIAVSGEVTVIKDRVVLLSYTNGIIAIEITSQTLADTMRGILELAWFAAEKLKTN